jgi:hypothetical protein
MKKSQSSYSTRVTDFAWMVYAFTVVVFTRSCYVLLVSIFTINPRRFVQHTVRIISVEVVHVQFSIIILPHVKNKRQILLDEQCLGASTVGRIRATVLDTMEDPLT